MKKVILILMMVLMSFSIVWAKDNPCNYKCQDQEIGHISYCNNNECQCLNFDYESQTGYIENFKAPKGIIFRLCDCEEIDEINSNENYYLSIKILTPGVYWNNKNPSLLPPVSATETDLAINSFASLNDLCNDLDGDQVIVQVPFFRNYLNSEIENYTGNSNFDNCELPEIENRAVNLITECKQIFKEGKPFLLIDLPELFYDNSIVNTFTKVEISVNVHRPSEICPYCSGFCSCTSNIGIFGSETQSLIFDLPYLVPTGNWWNGLTISNTSSQNNLITIKFHDGLNHEAVYTKRFDPYEQQSEIIAFYLNLSIGDDLIKAKFLNAEVYSSLKCEAVVILGDSSGFSGCYGYNK
jgi:hypothetical protein